MDELESIDPNLGISRRDLMRKGAVLGGTVLWAAPVVQSFTTPAFATGHSPAQGVGGISYVAVLVVCGTNCFVVKYEPEENRTTCGGGSTGVNMPCCTNFATLCTGTCPTTGTGTFTEGANGTVTYTPPAGCTVVDYRVHCGQCCEGPGAPNQPPVTGPFTFVQCTGVSTDPQHPHPCALTGNQSAPCNDNQHPAALHLEP